MHVDQHYSKYENITGHITAECTVQLKIFWQEFNRANNPCCHSHACNLVGPRFPPFSRVRSSIEILVIEPKPGIEFIYRW